MSTQTLSHLCARISAVEHFSSSANRYANAIVFGDASMSLHATLSAAIPHHVALRCRCSVLTVWSRCLLCSTKDPGCLLSVTMLQHAVAAVEHGPSSVATSETYLSFGKCQLANLCSLQQTILKLHLSASVQRKNLYRLCYSLDAQQKPYDVFSTVRHLSPGYWLALPCA